MSIPPDAGSMGDVRQQWAVLRFDGSVWRVAWERESGRPCVYPTRQAARFARSNAEMGAAANRKVVTLTVAKVYQTLIPVYGALEGLAGIPRERQYVRDMIAAAEGYTR